MAFNPDPDIYFPGITFDSANVVLPNDAFITYDENDSRSLIFALAQRIYDVYVATSGADRPEHMTITKTDRIFSVNGNPSQEVQQKVFTLIFNVEYAGTPTVVAESG